MPRTFSMTSYPLLKVLVPVALLVLLAGLYLFFTQPSSDGSLDPKVLLYFIVVAIALALASLLWRRREAVTVVLPSDRLKEASDKELDSILAELQAKRDAGELDQDRYQKAKARILKAKRRK
jgi:hypothetical protein